ncbi:hypothetical protein M5689_021358 [Euphorbia peplus]|nr:hypothetical protein M5689_021358 [Euphorbia peplus]
MSSSSNSQSIMPSIPNVGPNFDQHQWILHIRRSIEDELENETEILVSIFKVPKVLMTTDPDSYTPQLIALGPYHYWRPELFEMERYKLAAARRIQKQLGHDLKFQQVVDQLSKHDHQIRGNYHKFLDISHETFAWMMALDASFLLDFLQIYAIKEGMRLTRIASQMSHHLVDYAGRKSTHNAILKDMVMLENQIPLFVLRTVLEFQFENLDSSDEMLEAMVLGFCKEISPLKMMKLEKRKVRVSGAAHLLDYLYHSMVPKIEVPQPEITEAEERGSRRVDEDSVAGNSSYIKDLFSELWKIISKLHKGPFKLLQKLLKSRGLKVILKLPWKILSKLPGFSLLAQPVNLLLASEDDKEETKPENDASNPDKPPLVEEIAIPCVSELHKSGVRFLPTSGNIKSVSFDPKTVTFHLPVVSLDGNTEVLLRNLVAYEASSASGPLVFTRYTELMNGIIDTDEDVKLLREKGIVLNRLKSDKEVAEVWNGMNKSIRLTKVPFLDKVIEDVNKHYNGRWKVKVVNFMKKYVFGSWQFLTLLAAIMLLILMTLQAFCSVYDCARLFHISTTT